MVRIRHRSFGRVSVRMSGIVAGLLTVGASLMVESPASAAPVTIETAGTCFAWGTGSVKVSPQLNFYSLTNQWESITGEIVGEALVLEFSRAAAFVGDTYPTLQIDFYSTTDCSSTVTFSPRTTSLCVTNTGTNEFNVNTWGSTGDFVDSLTPSTIWDLTEGRSPGSPAVIWVAGVRFVGGGLYSGPGAGTMVLTTLPTSVLDVDATFTNDNGMYDPLPYGYLLSQAFVDTGIDYVTPLCTVGGAPSGGRRNPIDVNHYLTTSELPNTR